MKKIVSVLLVLVLLLPMCASAEQITVKPTTDKEICPLNLSWKITYAELEKALVENGGILKVEEECLGDGDSYSYSFGIVDLVESGNYKDFPTEHYWIDIENGSLHIGGYQAKRVVANFYRDTREMYLVSFYLNTVTTGGNVVMAEDMYRDLRNKLSSLYGTPVEKSWGGKGGIMGGKFVTNHCAWIGSHSTAVTLRWTYRIGTNIGFDGDEIEIEYGKTDSNTIMKEHKNRIEQEEQQKYRDAIESIKDDNSGL